jgi:hypothetical protein
MWRNLGANVQRSTSNIQLSRCLSDLSVER